MAIVLERVPSQPFADFLNEWYDKFAREFNPLSLAGCGGANDPTAQALCEFIGWIEADATLDGALRKLYRYRRSVMDKKRRVNGRIQAYTEHTDSFGRWTVEDALHFAGFTLEAVYGEWAAKNPEAVERLPELWTPLFERFAHDNGGLYPEKHCAKCDEVGPFEDGKCIWCLGKLEYRRREAQRKREEKYRRADRARYAAKRAAMKQAA